MYSKNFAFSWLAGVASGATRAALTQHFALEKNAADISAKVLRLKPVSHEWQRIFTSIC